MVTIEVNLNTVLFLFDTKDEISKLGKTHYLYKNN